MSLIHDALRKAAEEKKSQDGRPSSWRDVEPLPARRRSSWPWVVLVAVAAAGGFWLVFSGNPGNPGRTVTAVAIGTSGAGTTGTSGTSGTSEKKAAEEKVPLVPAPEKPALPVPAPQAPLPAPQPQNTTNSPEVLDVPDVPFVPDIPSPPPSPSPKLITPPARTGQVAQDTFVLEAQIDDQHFQLDFIVWSDSPFAQINGRQVGVGQQVDGFVVTAIKRDEVQLETPTRRLVIRIR